MGAAAIFEVPHVFTDAELAAVRFEQSADVMVFTHMSHPVQRLRRYAHNDWRWDDAPVGDSPAAPDNADAAATVTYSSAEDDGYVAQNYQYAVSAVYEETGRESVVADTDTVTNDLSIKGNYNTITWDAVTGAEAYRVYLKRNGAYGYLGQVLDGTLTFVDRNIEAVFSDAPPINLNPFADEAYPATVTFHQGRLAFGRTPRAPNAIHLSQTDDIFNFDRSSPQKATDALALGIRARRVNAIQHMVSLQEALIALTNDAIFAVTAKGEAFTVENISVRNQGYQGAGQCRPEAIVDVLFYVTAKGRVRTLGYQFEADGYKGNDITVFAPHLFSGFDLTEMAWCEHPSGVMWMRRNDGRLLALTWQAEQEVWGWTVCETDGFVESVCSVSENNADVLYALIRRTVGEESVRMVERLAYPHWIDENWSDLEASVVLDSSLAYDGDPVAVLTGLDHLEGRTVTALADGYVIDSLTVTDGAIDLGDDYSRVTVGLPFEGRIRTLPIVVEVQGQGSTKGRRQTPANVVVEVLNTRGAEYGKSAADEESATEMFDFQTPDGLAETYPEPLFSGAYDVAGFPSTDWKKAMVTVRQRKPLPLVVLSVNPDVLVGG